MIWALKYSYSDNETEAKRSINLSTIIQQVGGKARIQT